MKYTDMCQSSNVKYIWNRKKLDQETNLYYRKFVCLFETIIVDEDTGITF